jgi:diguanylate cyclase (GGDEF)-like protein
MVMRTSSAPSLIASLLALMPVPGAMAADAVAAESPARVAEALVESSERQMRRDPEQSRRDAERALEVLGVTPAPDLELRAHLQLCDYHSERDGAQARSELLKIENLVPMVERRGLAAAAPSCAGLIAEAAGDNAAARREYDEAVRIAEEAVDNTMLAEALFSRGYLLGVQGDYSSGLADLRRAQALFEKVGKPLHSLTTLNSIAIIYNRMGDTAQAQSIYQRALASQRAAGLTREETVTLYNLGRAAENLRQWPQARTAFEESLKLARQLDYRRAEVYALRGLAAVAVAAGRPQDALVRVQEALARMGDVPDARLAAQVALVEGSALRLLQRLPESRAALDRARSVMEEGDAQGELVTLYDEYAQLSVDLGDWRGAYDWRSRAREVNERLLRRQIDQRFATLKVEFDTLTKEKENAALLKANEAGALALEQTRRARSLQALVIGLAVLLAAVLGWVALHQRRSKLRMKALAHTDELTSAPNRRAVLTRLQELLAGGPSRFLCVLLLDIDHFKSINDRFGHPAGDKVLRAVAARLRAWLEPGDLHGRIGGEEFLVVTTGDSLEDVLARAEVLRFQFTTIDTHTWFDDGRTLTVSIGVTERRPDDNVSTLLQRADAALYAAKREGRNCVRHAPAATYAVR